MNQSAKKERLRKELLEMRRKMAFEDVFRTSLLVQKRFLESDFFRSAGRLSLYASFKNEVLTEEIFQRSIELGKEVYYPRVMQGRLGFYRVAHPGQLSSGSYDIREPGPDGKTADPASFDLVVVPGVAFDLHGSRLGYGKGYYDKALKGAKRPVVALAFDFQVLREKIPAEAHDIRMSAIVTEKRTIEV